METKRIQRHRWLGLWCSVVTLGLLAICIGVSLAGQQARHYRIAVLTAGWSYDLALAGLREGLAQLGYYEGTDLSFLVEDVQGDVADLAARAARIVKAKPDLIFTIGTAATAAAMQTTTTLPIVFTFVTDPLQSGLIASYTSSQNNLTGIATYAGPLSGKRLEILQEIAPGIRRVLLLVAPQERMAEVSFQAVAAVAPKLGIELLRYDVTSKADIEQFLNALPRGAVDAISHVPSTLVGTHLDLLIHKAKEDRIPLSVPEVSMVERGALVSYGADLRLLGLQAATLTAKVMKGAKPSEIPIQTPEPLLLAINLTTAKAIGLDIPRSILERTERFVE